MRRGLILSAPHSGSGKTTVTLGLLHALSRRGTPVRGAKSGPDYIDPHFHAAATGADCVNLDAWAMSPSRIRTLASGANCPPDLLLIEGAMGLFDGAPPDGKGATADLARILHLPVVLIVDAGRMAQSIAPLVAGFAGYQPAVRVAGVILNNVGSDRHATTLRRALAPLGLPILGVVPRTPDLAHPARHLGLVQAQEREDLTAFLCRAADLIERSIDLDALVNLAAPMEPSPATNPAPPPAQRIAVARDVAFAFSYPHQMAEWQSAGAEITFFSPLNDEPAPDADLIYLPGGYPELHAGQLAAAHTFMQSIKNAAQVTNIYGECGGYMVLGDSLTDANGTAHQMAGLLRLETSFAQRKLHLGYRDLSANVGPFKGTWAGHEFHYASTIRAQGKPLFQARDATGAALPPMGLREGRVAGSFAHLIDRRDAMN